MSRRHRGRKTESSHEDTKLCSHLRETLQHEASRSVRRGCRGPATVKSWECATIKSDLSADCPRSAISYLSG
jgi:hypothetical protein